jgi:hypothetical protein
MLINGNQRYSIPEDQKKDHASKYTIESTTDTLKELVMLLLQIPELFSKGHIMKVYCYAISFIF